MSNGSSWLTPAEGELHERLQAARQRVEDMESLRIHDTDERVAEASEAIENLYSAYIDLAVHWLEEKWGPDRNCPYCDTAAWSVSRPFNLLLESRETLAPHFSVLCTNCGHTVLVNAVLAGLFGDPAEEPF